MKAIITTAAVSAAALCATAFAGDRNLDVDIDEEMLETAEGRAEIMAELDEAAVELCTAGEEVTDGLITFDKCRVKFLNFIVDAVEDPRLEKTKKEYFREQRIEAQ